MAGADVSKGKGELSPVIAHDFFTLVLQNDFTAGAKSDFWTIDW